MSDDAGHRAAAAGATAVRAFATDLHRAEAGDGRNAVVSPWSVVAALAMVQAGAAGTTATQLDHVLHSPGDELAPAVAALTEHVAGLAGPTTNDGGGEAEVVLRTANAVWLQDGYPLHHAFTDTLAERFDAPAHTVDYAADPEGARSAVNAWVADRTAGRIPHLLPADAVTTLTRLILTNAVHLLAPWATAFGTPVPSPFHRLDGSTVDAALMGLQRGLPHRAGDGWQAVTVAYAGHGLAMTIVLPDEGRFAAVDRAADLAAWTAPADRTAVALRLPPFALDVAADLSATLAALGMPDAFDRDQADFSGMTAAERIHISGVAHQATITVDRNGTEAAAATAVVMAGRAALRDVPPPIEVVADRPFLFVLHDTEHRTPLFVGRVVDPTA